MTQGDSQDSPRPTGSRLRRHRDHDSSDEEEDDEAQDEHDAARTPQKKRRTTSSRVEMPRKVHFDAADDDEVEFLGSRTEAERAEAERLRAEQRNEVHDVDDDGDELEGLGVKELKAQAKVRRVDVSKCLEKADIVAAIRAAPAAAPVPPAPGVDPRLKVDVCVRKEFRSFGMFDGEVTEVGSKKFLVLWEDGDDGSYPLKSAKKMLDAYERYGGKFSDRPHALENRDLMNCSICEGRDLPKYGTQTRSYRDGYVMPKDNFSSAVQRGDYGKYCTRPFCLQHTLTDQNEYVAQLNSKTTRNGGKAECSDDDDDEEDGEQDNWFDPFHYMPSGTAAPPSPPAKQRGGAFGPEPSSEARDDAASAAPSNHSDDAPASDERFAADFYIDKPDFPWDDWGRFKEAGGRRRGPDEQWRKYAPAGSPKADFRRWTRARVYLNNKFSDKDRVKELGAKFDPARKKWFVPSYVQDDGRLPEFARYR